MSSPAKNRHNSKRKNLDMDDLSDVLAAINSANRIAVGLETCAGKPSLTVTWLDYFSRELRIVQQGLTTAHRALMMKLVKEQGFTQEGVERELMEMMGLVKRKEGKG